MNKKRIEKLLQESSNEYEAEFARFKKIARRVCDLLTCMDMWIIQFHNELCEECMQATDRGKGVVFVPEGKNVVFVETLKKKSADIRRLTAAADTFFASFHQMWPCEGSNPAPMHLTKTDPYSMRDLLNQILDPSKRPPPA